MSSVLDQRLRILLYPAPAALQLNHCKSNTNVDQCVRAEYFKNCFNVDYLTLSYIFVLFGYDDMSILDK